MKMREIWKQEDMEVFSCLDSHCSFQSEPMFLRRSVKEMSHSRFFCSLLSQGDEPVQFLIKCRYWTWRNMTRPRQIDPIHSILANTCLEKEMQRNRFPTILTARLPLIFVVIVNFFFSGNYQAKHPNHEFGVQEDWKMFFESFHSYHDSQNKFNSRSIIFTRL
jgi:hypothetical protein